MIEKVKPIIWIAVAFSCVIYFSRAMNCKRAGNNMDALWYMGLAIYFLIEADILGG